MIHTEHDLARELNRLRVPAEESPAYYDAVSPLWDMGYKTTSYNLTHEGTKGRVVFTYRKGSDRKTLAAFGIENGTWIAWPPPEKQSSEDTENLSSFEGGGVRESQDGRPMPSLLWPKDVPHDDQFLTLMAQEMADGARKYDERNWENFRDEKALEHTKNSVLRHVFAWAAGETDENHGVKAALNLMFYHTIQYKMENDSE